MLGIVAICLSIWYILRRFGNARKANPKSLPYPPGPPLKWIVGNFAEMPTPIKFEALVKWKEEFGELTFFQALGQSVLVLNSLKAATDLLEKRGALYAHRPQLVVAGELMGLDQGIAMMEYCPKQRLFRKLAHRALGPEAVKRYEPLLEKHTLLLLQALLKGPDDFEAAIRLTTARNILSVSYGLDIGSAESEYIINAEKVMNLVERAAEPGAFIADFFPVMKYIPSWFPFASFKRLAEQGRKQIDEFMEQPFAFVKKEMDQGVAHPSPVFDMLSDNETLLKGTEKVERERIIMLLFGGLYGAGTATSSATLLIFVMLMALNPEKQRIAQDEIDSVTEGRRLPNLTDRARLPYVAALVKEVMRWHPVVPLGLPRQTRTDDEYNGYFIPANTIVLYNLWAMGKTEGSSPCLEDFSPERHLGDESGNVPHPHAYVFGFGRRICPGRFLVDSALFSICVSVLACFNISRKKSCDSDSSGGLTSEIPIPLVFTRHLISYPESFLCDIRPRSATTVGLIDDTFASSDSLPGSMGDAADAH